MMGCSGASSSAEVTRTVGCVSAGAGSTATDSQALIASITTNPHRPSQPIAEALAFFCMVDNPVTGRLLVGENRLRDVR
ncbi:hypothetical protein [Larkinella knui]|uniref:Uncharacterized protein n=1 Tax=Larkinella knui TaxID=2025310 RepID=A0A3P1CAK3_9BACT|nr:hypothetical protein [Larkinella knui]RRB10333.1 hypothetical protein EHT87_29340 [Larkinella knui]